MDVCIRPGIVESAVSAGIFLLVAPARRVMLRAWANTPARHRSPRTACRASTRFFSDIARQPEPERMDPTAPGGCRPAVGHQRADGFPRRRSWPGVLPCAADSDRGDAGPRHQAVAAATSAHAAAVDAEALSSVFGNLASELTGTVTGAVSAERYRGSHREGSHPARKDPPHRPSDTRRTQGW